MVMNLSDVEVIEVRGAMGVYVGFRSVVRITLEVGLTAFIGCTCHEAHPTEHAALACDATQQILSKHRRAA